MLLDFGKPAQMTISLTMELFGFRKAALDGLFSSLVDTRSDLRVSEFVCFILVVLPYVTPQALGLLLLGQARFSSRAACASAVFASVFPVAVSVGSHVFEVVPFGTNVYVPFFQINKLVFPVLPFLLTAAPVSHRRVYFHIVQILAYGRRVESRIQAHRKRLEAELAYLVPQPVKIGLYIVYVSRRDIRIRYDIVP